MSVICEKILAVTIRKPIQCPSILRAVVLYTISVILCTKPLSCGQVDALNMLYRHARDSCMHIMVRRHVMPLSHTRCLQVLCSI